MARVNSAKFNFREAIEQYLDDYKDKTVMVAMHEVIDEVGKESVKRLRATAPKGKTGDYRRYWAYQSEYQRSNVGGVVYGKKAETYAVAHLLEHGHVTRNGTGRTFGQTSPKVHIQPVEEWAMDELMTRLKERLGG